MGDDSRPVAVVHGMERAFPGLRLGWRISETGQFLPLPQRDATVAQERPDGGFPLLSNDNENDLVTVTGLETSAVSSSGGQAQLEVHARLPLAPVAIEAAAEVLGGRGRSRARVLGACHAVQRCAGCFRNTSGS
jgi:hypothetical protein